MYLETHAHHSTLNSKESLNWKYTFHVLYYIASSRYTPEPLRHTLSTEEARDTFIFSYVYEQETGVVYSSIVGQLAKGGTSHIHFVGCMALLFTSITSLIATLV